MVLHNIETGEGVMKSASRIRIVPSLLHVTASRVFVQDCSYGLGRKGGGGGRLVFRNFKFHLTIPLES